MNKFYTFLFLLFLLYNKDISAQKQDISLQNLIECSFMEPKSFVSYMAHKGFKAIENETSTTDLLFERCLKDKTTKRMIERKEDPETIFITFQTTSKTEYLYWEQELQASKFSFYKDSTDNKAAPLFQKKNITAELSQYLDEEKTQYRIKLKCKKLPSPADIRYAEDLLQLNTHEYIVAVFGANNVKKDVFYFSEKEVNKCSILFPNTSNQVIFIWNDEVYNRDISFLLLGGNDNHKGSHAIYDGNQFHKWRSKQGLYLGMSLKELQSLNGTPLEFYGWGTDQPGFVIQKNNGKINFNALGLQLQCLDCYTDNSYTTKPILSSDDVLKTSDRIMINSLIVLPDKHPITKNNK